MALMATEILDFLAAEGLIGGATGWARAATYLPPSPDQVIAVFSTPGDPPEITPSGSAETAYDEPGFQVRGRGAEFGAEALENKMWAVYRALHDGDVGGNYVLVRAVQSGPMMMGYDASGRPEMTWNFSVIRERS